VSDRRVTGDNALARLARLAGRRPWWWIGAWAAVFLALGAFAGRAQGVLSNGGFDVPGSQSERVVNYFQHLPVRGSQPFTFLVDAPDRGTAAARLAAVVAATHAAHPELVPTGQVATSPDGRTASTVAYAALDQNGALALAGKLKQQVQVVAGPVRTFVLGPAATYDTFQHITTTGLARAEAITALPLVLVLLALFGAAVAASVPLLQAVVAVAITFGITYFVASETEVSIFATTMISMIGIGVAVDYTLFVLARFREELGRGAEVADAVATAMRTSGTAVVFSGVTVILSLLSILLVPVRAVQSMAAAAATVTLVSVLAAATFLPALLHLLGRRVERLRIGRRRTTHPAAGSPFWRRFVARIMHHPVIAFALAAGALVLCATPSLALETANTSVEQIPRGDPVRVGSALLVDRITGPGRGREGAVSILLRPRGPLDARLAAAARGLAAALARDPDITTVSTETAGRALVVIGQTRLDPEGRAATLRLVPRVRRLAAADAAANAVARVDVGGVSAFQRDLNEEIGGDLWKVIVFVVVLAYVVLLVLLRSVLLPLKAVLMNLLSIGAAYGVVVAIFQWGWLDWLGYHSLGHVSTLNPALILAITFGLSMDYEVFLLSRIGERYAAHGDNERAVAEGIASSARLITSAATIMVLVFSAFVLTGLPAIKEIGVGLASAIAVDATITRLVLVPATMRLLGDWNWWLPAWLDRLLPHLGHGLGVSETTASR
jgi:RND superfamily putative drug exporter